LPLALGSTIQGAEAAAFHSRGLPVQLRILKDRVTRPKAGTFKPSESSDRPPPASPGQDT
jgi:hypothetical protein